jgi:hypothetical protein
MVDYIKTYEQTKGNRKHPVGMTWQYKNGSNNNLTSSSNHSEWISLGTNTCDITNYAPPVASGNKIIISDTDHLGGICGDRQWVWRSFTRGENPIYMDFYNNDATGRGMPFNHAQAPEIRNNMGYVRSYALRMDLTQAIPTNSASLCSTTYCLRNTVTDQYLVYVLGGTNSATVNLAVTLGTNVTYEWFSTVTGSVVETNTRTVNTVNQTFNKPGGMDDAVLYIYIP